MEVYTIMILQIAWLTAMVIIIGAVAIDKLSQIIKLLENKEK